MNASTPAASLRRRQDKPTVEIPRRTLDECNARYAAYQSQVELGLPTVRLDR